MVSSLSATRAIFTAKQRGDGRTALEITLGLLERRARQAN
jgi:hypothetical protein